MPPLPGVPSSVSQALKLWAQQVLAQIQAAGGAAGVNAVPQQYALVAGSALPPIASVSNCTVALDTTKQLFGAGSYKVSLTGSPAVLTLASDTAWPMQPGWQWLVSFFQQATAAIAGEVTVTTSAGKAYSATFTTTLDSAGWDRLYDALNLVADTSAAFGLSFTFTGGAGQTVWLDGLMLSPFYGRPSGLPSFQNGSAPLLLDNNPDGFYSKILTSRTAGNVAFNFRGAWSSTASYLTGDEVVYGPTYWVALANSTNVQPATGVSSWQAVGSYSAFVGAWSSTVTYAVGAEVTYSGNYWVAVAQNSKSAPSTTNANWQIAGPAALDYVADGPTLYARVPITHFDNLTNRNISLGYTVDGSARFAVTNAADMAGVSSVDSNNRALIDFSQSGHLYKNLSNVADYGARNAVQAARLPNGSAGWFNLGTWDFATIPDSFRIDLISGTGYNPNGSQQTYTQIFMRTANYGGGGTTAPNVSGLTWQSHGGSTPITEVKLVASGSNTTGTGNSWDLYVYLNAFAGGEISWHTNSVSTFTLNGAPASDPGAASATVVIGTGGQITNTGGTGQDAILDGTTYASFPISNFDNLTNRRIATINGGMNPLGSIPPGATDINFTYTSTTDSITISWPAMTVYRIDGTTTTVNSGSFEVTGLSAGTGYYFYPYLYEPTATIEFVTGASGSTGSPAAAYAAASTAAAGAALLQTNAPFGQISGSTTTSGTGGGGTGPTGCLHSEQAVEMADGSTKRAVEIRVGDYVTGPNGAVRVRAVKHVPWRMWTCVKFNTGARLHVVFSHRFIDPSDAEVLARELHLGQIVAGRGGPVYVTGLETVEDDGVKVSLEVEAPHVYFVQGILSHNKLA